MLTILALQLLQPAEDATEAARACVSSARVAEVALALAKAEAGRLERVKDPVRVTAAAVGGAALGL